jgi:uncharacterized protein YcnI
VKLFTAARRLAAPVALVALAMLIAPASAFAHARVSPAVSLSGELQLYSLAVPTEKANVTTTKIVMTVPSGFGIDSFAPPPPGWTMSAQQTGAGNNTVVQKVTWTGGHTPTGEDSLFQFLAQPAAPGTYTFTVAQTYSDGSIVNWSGPQSSAAPSPAITAQASLGSGDATTPLTLVALIIATLGLLAGGAALVAGRGGGNGVGDGDAGSGRRPLA